ncbi:MAG: hypothetical protein H6828_11735 [Planctomycetes bacterium]|nr:hypothetical protein [Planctomycetota bacterium]
MRPRSLRLCAITPQADALVEFLGLGLGFECEAKELPGVPNAPTGGLFATASGSRIEVWPEGEGLPAGLMLQVEVEDADAVAAHAKLQGLDPKGPFETADERMYYLLAPGGLAMTVVSAKG